MSTAPAADTLGSRHRSLRDVVTDELRDCAIAEGARPVDSRTVVRALRAAGLRQHPTRTTGHHQP